MPDGTQLSHITPPDQNSALGKSIVVLSAILNANKPPSLGDIALVTGIPRPTVFRIIKQLEDTLLVTRTSDSEKYLVGPNLMTLATDALSAFTHAAPVRSILSGLVHDIGETCNLGVLERDSVVYIDRVECAWPLRLQIGIGSRVSLHATAIGKLLMAHLPSRTRKRILSTSALEKYTPKTITSPSALETEFKYIRRQGYACNDEENTVGLMGIAVPVFDPKGRVVAGLSLHAPAARLSIEGALTKLDRFKNAAMQIEAAMRDQQISADEQSGDA